LSGGGDRTHYNTDGRQCDTRLCKSLADGCGNLVGALEKLAEQLKKEIEKFSKTEDAATGPTII
jgi:hypothetical protein